MRAERGPQVLPLLTARRKPHRRGQRRGSLPAAAARGYRIAASVAPAYRGPRVLRRRRDVVRGAEVALVTPERLRPRIPAACPAKLRLRCAREPLQLRAAAVGLRDSS